MDGTEDVFAAIQASHLDFDLPKQCSVTLSHLNVYVCMTCGKFLQGRLANSPVHVHSLNTAHPAYMSLADGRLWMMPINREVTDSSPVLEAIRKDLFPDRELIRRALQERLPLRDALAKEYRQGFLPLNLPKHPVVRSVLLMMSHLPEICSFYLFGGRRSAGEALFADFMLRLWNPSRARMLLTPHDLMNALADKAPAGMSSDLGPFLAVFLNTLIPSQKALFLGRLQVRAEDETLRAQPFMFLSIDIPALPLFQDVSARKIIPQHSLPQLMGEKYGGRKAVFVGKQRCLYYLQGCPRYLAVLYRGRTYKSSSNEEAINNSIISFPDQLALFDAASRYQLVGCVSIVPGDLVAYVRDATTQEWFQFEGIAVRRIGSIEQVRMSDCVLHIWQRVQ